MEETGHLGKLAYNLINQVNSAHHILSSEVYSGNWKDSVGESFLGYLEGVRRSVNELNNLASNLSKVEQSLNSFNEQKDQTTVNNLEASVNRL